MTLEQQLVAIERKLWKNDAVLYEENLIPEALLVFAETGVITRDVALDAIRQENAEGRRWADVKFDDIRTLPLGKEAALLTYKATAQWEGQTGKMVALCTSAYTLRNNAWKLALHQQTALDATR
jgi:hypothetical protein